ncbi:MAG: hypothetical protein V4857_23465 [Pseudomonadota bacterium]
MNKLLIGLLVAAIGAAGCNRQADDVPAATTPSSAGEAAGIAVANTALQVSKLDVSALTTITPKLEAACARNKYGLSEAECRQKISERKELCSQQTARQYPGELGNVNRMQEVVATYVDCLLAK